MVFHSNHFNKGVGISHFLHLPFTSVFPPSIINHGKTFFTASDRYQSSSSSPPLLRPCILACLALNASAKPPAKLDPPDVLPGVSRPLSLPILTALSLGVGVGSGCLRTAALGRFAGGAGGFGLPCLLLDVPLGG